MRRAFIYFWDPSPGGNIEHVGDNNVTQEEFEEVTERGFASRERSRAQPIRPNRWEVEDYTGDGTRYLIVIFELDDLREQNAWGITPVTAYEPEEPFTKG